MARARRLYLSTLEATPDHASACNNLGLLDASAEQMSSAREWFERALEIDPSSLDASTNLVQTCIALQDADAAAEHLASALTRHADEEHAALLERSERFALEALERRDLESAWRVSRLLARSGGGATTLAVLAQCVGSIDARSAPHEVRDDLMLCFAADELDHRDLARATVQCLEVSYRWIRQPPEEELIDTAISTGFADDALLRSLLERSINVSPSFEALLRALRRAFLSAMTDGHDPGPDANALLAALAIQCFSSEYVWSVESDEVSALDALTARLALGNGETRRRGSAVVACYLTPGELREHGLDDALDAEHAPWLDELSRRLFDEPSSEAELAATLDQGQIADTISKRVRAQYEHAPYPRWLTLAPEPEDTLAGHLSRVFPGLRPPAFLDAPIDVLIAGCGTGEHALRVARRHPGSRIHAMDLSRASLGYAMRKARELGLDNVRFQHGDLLSLADTEPRFHAIESVGVLHHLRQPKDGLAALSHALIPGGVMKLGLYSRSGRRDVRQAWQRIQALGLTRGGDEELRTLRQRVLDGGEPELKALLRSDDFYTLSTLRDLLFHVQEHQFTLAEIRGLLDDAGLMLIGFQAPDGVHRRYVARYRNDPWMQNMENLMRFEREHPMAFAGMYQFWCFKPPG